MRYEGYSNRSDLARHFGEFSTAVDKSVSRMKATEDVEDSRLGVGHWFTGYEDGKFITARRGGKNG